MTSALTSALGPPGAYLQPDLETVVSAGLRMDICGFIGVTARGPAWQRCDDPTLESGILPGGRARSIAVPVQSWAEFEEIFGGDAGPGLLPRTVAAYFLQGGRTAYVVRSVPSMPVPEPRMTLPSAGSSEATDQGAEPAAHGPRPSVPACALFRLAGSPSALWLRAANEGSWGNDLVITLTFRAAALLQADVTVGHDTQLTLPPGVELPVGSVIRVRSEGSADPTVHTVSGSRPGFTAAGWRTGITLDPAPPAGLAADIADGRAAVEIITGELRVSDGTRSEQHPDLGLHPDHPRWLGTELIERSRLLDLEDTGEQPSVLPDPQLTARPGVLALPGADRYAGLVFDDILGPEPVTFFGGGDFGGSGPGGSGSVDTAPAGVGALSLVPECASVCAPDLYSPETAEPDEQLLQVADPVTSAGADFRICLPVVHPEPTRPDPGALPGLRLDPSLPGDLNTIIELQNRLIRTAARQGLVTLLDVPPKLRPSAVRRWRSGFDTSWAAGYLGWPRVPDPARDGLRPVPPSGCAAGVMAVTELRRGLPWGPAQQGLIGAVAVLDGPGAVQTADHQTELGELHRMGINVTVLLPAEVRQTAARTLSLDPAFRQLTTRRLLNYLQRRITIDLAWAVFEPNNALLRTQVRLALENVLEELYLAGAFAGADRPSSYFVRTVGETTGSMESDLLCEIGVAPAEPLEFLLVRLLRTDDGALTAVPADRSVPGAGR